jgi:cyclic pyranopterin phosphate synthase
VNREASRKLDESVRTVAQLVDRFGRVHTSLRVSVTDACNIRCRYCMPEKVTGFMPQHQLMSFEEIERVVRALSHSGIKKIRLTGGEPLMRPGLPELVQRLAGIHSLEQIAITTNGMMLQEVMADLKTSGLTHINISLDTLREQAFQSMSRRTGLDRVLAGIEAAVASGLPVRLNAVVLKDVNLEDCVPLVKFAVGKGVTIRFIEFMPLDADRSWSQSQVVPGSKLRERLELEMGPMQEKTGTDPSQPSRDYVFLDGEGSVGFIDPVSQPFCSNCNRLRLTADGKFRNCLFGREDWDIMSLLRRGTSDAEILDVASRCVEAKHPSHGISEDGFEPPVRAMYQIGG